jgi:YHS domain-containing protein
MDDTDPVCGRELESETAPERSLFAGDLYSFCSTPCREEFDRAPERYVAVRAPR